MKRSNGGQYSYETLGISWVNGWGIPVRRKSSRLVQAIKIAHPLPVRVNSELLGVPPRTKPASKFEKVHSILSNQQLSISNRPENMPLIT